MSSVQCLNKSVGNLIIQLYRYKSLQVTLNCNTDVVLLLSLGIVRQIWN